MKRKKYIVFILLVNICFHLFSQNYPLNTASCFENGFEKIFVHLDKSSYSTGSVIKHKAYALNGWKHTLSNSSKIVYYEIVGANGVVLNWRSNLENGIAYSEISIPDTIPTGQYKFRAFTNWAMSLNEKYAYQTDIYINNIRSSGLEEIPVTQSISTSQPIFSPLGGNLLDGIKSTIGYSGCLAGSNGNVVDQTGAMVANFTVNKNGYGKFEFIPTVNKVYTVNYTSNNNVSESKLLPLVQINGYYLNISTNNRTFKIVTSGNAPENFVDNNLFMLIANKGHIIFNEKLNFISGKSELIFSTDTLKEGIYYIALIDKKNTVLSEMLYYLSSEQKGPNLIASIDKKEASKRDQVNLSINLGDFNNVDSAMISISVSEKSPFYSNETVNSFYDYGELRCATKPVTYSAEEINTFLLSVPINQYLWKDEETLTANYDHVTENKGYILKGNIKNKISGKPFQNKTIAISKLSGKWNLKYTFTDMNGDFYFYLEKELDNRQLFFQVLDSKLSNNDITWEMDKKSLKSDYRTSYSMLTPQIKNYLDYDRNIQISNRVFFKKTKDTTMYLNGYTDNFYLKPDYTIYPEDFVELPDFIEITKNITPGVKYKYNKKTGKYELRIYDAVNKIVPETDATVFINGVIITDFSLLKDLGSKEIQKIEVVQSEVFYGDISFVGIINIVTSGTKEVVSYLKKNTYIFNNTVLENKGSVNFDLKNRKEDIPELKQNLYWNPSISLTKQNSLKLNINTGDLASEYVVRINGITNKGDVLNKTLEFKVK